MGKMRGIVQKSNKYYLPKHRFYELYHYCLQYPEWLSEYNSIGHASAIRMDGEGGGSGTGDPTYTAAERRLVLRERLDEIEKAAAAADPQLSRWILMAVTQEHASYAYLRNVYGMPCGRKMFYDRRRRFYWIMAKMKAK